MRELAESGSPSETSRASLIRGTGLEKLTHERALPAGYQRRRDNFFVFHLLQNSRMKRRCRFAISPISTTKPQKNSVFPFSKRTHERTLPVCYQQGKRTHFAIKICVKRNPRSTHGRARQLCNQHGRRLFSCITPKKCFSRKDAPVP